MCLNLQPGRKRRMFLSTEEGKKLTNTTEHHRQSLLVVTVQTRVDLTVDHKLFPAQRNNLMSEWASITTKQQRTSLFQRLFKDILINDLISNIIKTNKNLEKTWLSCPVSNESRRQSQTETWGSHEWLLHLYSLLNRNIYTTPVVCWLESHRDVLNLLKGTLFFIYLLNLEKINEKPNSSKKKWTSNTRSVFPTQGFTLSTCPNILMFTFSSFSPPSLIGCTLKSQQQTGSMGKLQIFDSTLSCSLSPEQLMSRKGHYLLLSEKKYTKRRQVSSVSTWNSGLSWSWFLWLIN